MRDAFHTTVFGRNTLRHAVLAGLFAAALIAQAPQAVAAPKPPSASTTWRVTLPAAPGGTWNVTLAVYNAQGTKVRSIYTNTQLAAGTYSSTWDGKNDSGVAQAAGTYTFRLFRSSMNYVWEGVIGNTSASFDGTQVHTSLYPASSIAINGSEAFLGLGYNEQQPMLSGFSLSSPQQAVRRFASSDPFSAASLVAADDNTVYWANTGGVSGLTSFVGAYSRANNLPQAFASGQAVCLQTQASGVCYPGQSYSSVIDVLSASSAGDQAMKVATGLAVQRSGNLLVVAHGGLGKVRVFNKVTGVQLNEFAVGMVPRKLNQIALTAAGDLWIISGSVVQRYTNIATSPALNMTLSGLAAPLALAAEEAGNDNGGVWVADGGSNQQLRHFDVNGNPGSAAGDVVGTAGGYASSPVVASNKLCFKGYGSERTALALDASGNRWVLDTCNNRLLRFAAGAASADTQVAYLPAHYTATVDHGNSGRVFANYLEFRNDSTRASALQAGGAAWPLVRNWVGGLPAELTDASSYNGGFGGFTSVETLSNSRTYALLNVNGRQALAELPSSGAARYIKLLDQPLTGATNWTLFENGELGYAVSSGGVQTVYRAALTGFDGSGNPLWAAATAQASVPMSVNTPYYRTDAIQRSQSPRFPVTSGGKVVFFDSSVTGNSGFHLGAAQAGTNSWLWQASPSAAMNPLTGTYQTQAIDGSVNYGGTVALASGTHIVYGYRGAAFVDQSNNQQGYANQFLHFDESGKFLGQFGEATTRTTRPNGAQQATNPMSLTLVQEPSSGPLFFYSSDESGHGGVHRWRLDGASSVGNMSGSGTLGSTVTLN